jgi:hypothetical protein
MAGNGKSDNQCGPECGRVVPLHLVLLDNVPTLLLFILGYAIIARLSIAAALCFLAYALSTIVWFWARICPYCRYFGTLSCPCGYGIVSAKLFKRKTGRAFRTTFRMNIVALFPNWFVPPAAGVYALITDFSLPMLILVIAFCIDGFLFIPLISKLVGCKNCETKADCPWMSKK